MAEPADHPDPDPPTPPELLSRLVEGLTDRPRLAGIVGSRPGQGARQAAVLILIATGADGPAILFVERSRQLRNHAGQIAFPGGGVEPDDVDLAVCLPYGVDVHVAVQLVAGVDRKSVV